MWICVRKHLTDFHLGKPCVKRNRNDSQPSAGIQKLDVLGAIGEEESKSVPSLKAMSAERGGYGRNAGVELPKG
jgi:hypothetical protein